MTARIAFVLADDFEDVEFSEPHQALRDHGFEIDVIGAEAGAEVTGKRDEVTQRIDLAASDASPDDYSMLVVPGGYSPDKLRTDAEVVDFVRAMAERGPVAAICHAGSLLIEADLVAGKRLTSWPSIRTDLRNAGANWVDEEVVHDGDLITSRDPGDLPAFTKEILAELGALEASELA